MPLITTDSDWCPRHRSTWSRRRPIPVGDGAQRWNVGCGAVDERETDGCDGAAIGRAANGADDHCRELRCAVTALQSLLLPSTCGLSVSLFMRGDCNVADICRIIRHADDPTPPYQTAFAPEQAVPLLCVSAHRKKPGRQRRRG